ncbi:MAG: phosphatidylcholine/phosphatidylserine synthase [Methylocystis sp.]|nr:phosphatidylcholine/phosphatidylserine synthase [Methylocystis sp.]MCA3582589.1 phosphatidylcholine/phosphatidylserine synthase [Methylocystis sp.]MCA3586888.1 phosphatidylcholine/phosphatidylserine synthase [Methylocystis sp.]MCA3591738.1 phosphatidylcholine/phosphatidylserine synthase [Methylocystis sp.]
MTDLFPPFQPDPDEPKRRRFKPVPLRVLIPNMVTLLALCLGLTAIRLAIEGRIDSAVYAILFAALLDGIDGNLARYLKGTSRFGAELDSLADFVNFGCVPALVLYFWMLKDLKALGWIVCLVFAIAMVLRLARFNVMLDDPTRPEWKKGFFVGMPAPMGAACVLLPLYASLAGLLPNFPGLPFLVLLYTLLIAFFTISTIPTISSKRLSQSINRSYVVPMFVLGVLLVGLLGSHTFETLSGLIVLYLISLPVGIIRYREMDRKWRAAMAGETAQTAAPTPPA